MRHIGWIAVLISAGCTEVIVGSRPTPTTTPDVEDIEDTVPPEAVCAALPDPASPLETVDLIGENSFDPDGIPILSYSWDLAQTPEGSSARLPSGEANRLGFQPDVSGVYTATLTVINDRGTQSETCATSFDVIPDHRLWVELTWAFPDENLDLQISRELENPTADDICSVLNCTEGLPWGDDGPSDDPILARDDVDETGPESGGILDPADGDYFIGAYDNPLHRRAADNVATLTVFIDGVAAWTGTRTFVEEGQFKPFVKVSWPSGAIEEL